MTEEQMKQLAKKEADKIREKVRNGTLFGKPVDMNNMDAVIFAVYLMGVQDGDIKPV